MRFFNLFLWFSIPSMGFSQSIGVKTSDPQTLLDVNGSVAFRESSPLSISNGTNDNVAIDSMSFYRIVAPTAAFTLTGFTNGKNGRMLILVNATTYDMSLQHQTGSTAANQINTGNGNTMIIAPNGSATLFYSTGLSKWVVVGSSGGYLSQMPLGVPTTGVTTDKILTNNNGVMRQIESIGGTAKYVIKAADESLTSNTTLQDDNELQFTIEANAQYEIYAQLYVDGSGGHIKYAVDIPSGSLKIDLKQWREVGSSGTGHEILTGDNVATVEQFDVSSVVGITNAIMVGIISTGATAGTVKIRWAQRVADVVTTFVRRGSYLKMTKI
jgi:hypothetical protein